MNYFVHWTDEALDHLTAIWLRATDRAAVTAAQTTIDRLLATDPWSNSLPVSEGLFAIEVRPLRAKIEVSEADRRVTVVSVSLLL